MKSVDNILENILEQLCLQDTTRSAKQHHQAAVVYWVSLCVKYCRVVDSVPKWRLSPTNWPADHMKIADYNDIASGAGTLTILESRSLTVENLLLIIKYSLLRTIK